LPLPMPVRSSREPCGYPLPSSYHVSSASAIGWPQWN